MKTKQEYIDDLDQMEESYYNFDSCISAMNKFKECVNSLTELVNEHFDEKVETNFEHYKDLILECCIDNLAVVKGSPTRCYKTNCNDCDFKINQIGCRQKAKEWLNQTYKKLPYKLSKFEFDIIQTYSDCHESCKFSDFKQLIELKDKGYFNDVDKNESIKDIIANCEVIE